MQDRFEKDAVRLELRKVEMSNTALDNIRSSKTDWLVIAAALAVYVLGMLTFYPDIITNVDEWLYVRHAIAFANGDLNLVRLDVNDINPDRLIPGGYPPGTSALLTPFVYLFGWRGAYLVPMFALVSLVFFTAKWLDVAGERPIFSLFVLLFPAVLVLGRVCMSDVICAAFTTAALMNFWIGLERNSIRHWWLSGFLAGLSLLFRETGVLVIIPFYLGAVLRRDASVYALFFGGLAGAALRPVGSAIAFGNALYVKDAGYGFSLSALTDTVPLYLISTLIFVPGGLIALFAYRGRRQREVIGAGLLPILFFCLYEYTASESGGLKSLILSNRFLIPVVPVLAFTLACTLPRGWEAVRKRFLPGSGGLEKRAALLLGGFAAAASFSVHVFMHEWNASQAEIRSALFENTSENVLVVTNSRLTRKYLSGFEGHRKLVDLLLLKPHALELILGLPQGFDIALLERNDSSYWTRQSALYQEALKKIRGTARMQLKYDTRVTPTSRVRVWHVDAWNGGASADSAADS